ncbi:MAG TPA: DUF5916 domain-containing protein [Gemmatimonadaceae bacterium]|nr:DUF5916 domain-containing protein [Gemmatimonadaceae bacterium]
MHFVHRTLLASTLASFCVARAEAQPSPPTAMPPASAVRRMSAFAITAAPKIDGVLDDAVWRTASPGIGFVQSEPHTGAPGTELTEVRVLVDARALYVGAYLHDADPGRIVVNDIRKDFKEDDQDTFELLIDTFHDRANGYVFIVNAEGARTDKQVANEGRETNASWDGVWSVKTHRVKDGWTVEMEIPFATLRYDLEKAPTWGINFARRIRRKNEIDFWSPVPRQYNLARVSLAGDLEGVGRVSASRDFRIKPYVAANTVRAAGGAGFDNGANVGADIKYGVTRGLTLDVTVHPDFAQVEADSQAVNLTQFSQFFQEKREFFIENSGIFYVGDAARVNKPSPTLTPDEDLLLFHSRRIGLTPAGTPITIPAGVRLTGKAGPLTLGALTMQTRAEDGIPASNYSVVRARRSFTSGSDFGVLLMNRQSDSAGDYNRVYGGDANIRFRGKVDWNSYVMGSSSPNDSGGRYAARTSLNYEGKFYHGKGAVLQIGDGFVDDLGFMRRNAVRKYLLDTGIRPRFSWLAPYRVRELHPHVTWNYYENLHGDMIGKNLHTGFTFFMNSGAYIEYSENPRFEYIANPFRINSAIPAIPAGSYSWDEHQIKGQTDPSRRLSAIYTLISGGLWSGTQRSQQIAVTARPSYHFGATIGATHTAAILNDPAAHFDALVWTGRANYSFSPVMFLDALTQFDPRKHQFNANVRFKFTHHPLSDIFIVLNEQRFTTPDAPVAGRSVIVKFTQMFTM